MVVDAPIASAAPANDLKLIQFLLQYKKFEPMVADAGLENFNQTWGRSGVLQLITSDYK